MTGVSIEHVKKARERIGDKVRHTPILRAEKLDPLVDAQVFLKPENLQITGSFKIRGAMNKILTLSDEERGKGIIASSSGNHAQGVAYASQMLGVKAIVVMPENAPKTKVEGTKSYGAEVVLHGFDSVQRYKKLYELRDKHGYTVVHSFNDPELIAGQGTSGLELIEDLPEVDTVVVPLGGGGLMAGVAVAVKETNPKVRVIGVEPTNIARYAASRKAGKPVEVEMGPTLADGLMLTMTGEHNYPLIDKYVDEVVAGSDPFIQQALSHIVFKSKLLVEPSAAIGLAAALEGTFKVRKGERICFFLSGGNIDPETLVSLITS
jgi:threonine dehydratase